MHQSRGLYGLGLPSRPLAPCRGGKARGTGDTRDAVLERGSDASASSALLHAQPGCPTVRYSWHCSCSRRTGDEVTAPSSHHGLAACRRGGVTALACRPRALQRPQWCMVVGLAAQCA
jgi:hypothetical protein